MLKELNKYEEWLEVEHFESRDRVEPTPYYLFPYGTYSKGTYLRLPKKKRLSIMQILML